MPGSRFPGAPAFDAAAVDRQRPIEPAGTDVRLAVGDGGDHLRRGVGHGEPQRKLLLGGELRARSTSNPVSAPSGPGK